MASGRKEAGDFVRRKMSNNGTWHRETFLGYVPANATMLKCELTVSERGVAGKTLKVRYLSIKLVG